MRKECRILQHIADDLFIMSEYPPSSCDFKSEQSSAKTLTLVKISTNLRYLIFVSTCIFSLFLMLCLILTKNSHCSTDNRNVSCFLWEFCLLYMMWCLSTKMLKGTTRHQREFILRNFDFGFFFHEKISVDFEFASLLLHLVGLSAGS